MKYTQNFCVIKEFLKCRLEKILMGFVLITIISIKGTGSFVLSPLAWCWVLFQGFPKGDFLSDDFPSGNFPSVQFPKGQVRPSEAPQAAMEGRALRLGWTRGLSAAARPGCGGASAAAMNDLESYCLGNCTFGKLPLGKIPLGSTQHLICMCTEQIALAGQMSARF